MGVNLFSSSLYKDFYNSNLKDTSPFLNSLGSKLKDVKLGLKGGSIFLLITSLKSIDAKSGCYKMASASPRIPNLYSGFLVNNLRIKSLASGLPMLGGNERGSLKMLLNI